jgi:hypothetical protein
MTRPDGFPDVSTWFGPLDPLPPVAPGQVAGRRLDYPSGWNLLVSPRGEDAVPASVLRALADDCDLVRLAIETRKDQLAGLDWRIARRGGGKASDPRIARATSLLTYPDREHAWDEWVRLIVEDMLVLDAATIYPRRALDGSLWALDAIDGGTIKRVIDDWGRTPEPPFPAYQQILKGLPATDYTADQLLYVPRNPRTHRLYGFPPVEQILLTVNVALRRQAHRLEYYTEGSQPDAFFGVPADWTTEQLRQYQEYWDALLAGNTAQRRRMRFIHGAVQYIETKPAILKDEFDEWLARVVCFAFSISPAPFVRQLNRASAETQDQAALREGMAPLMRWLKRVVDRILGQVLGWPDLEFVWQDTTEQDPETQARIAVSLVGAGITTRNEARATLGLPPIQGGDALTTAGPAVPLAKAADWNPDAHPRWPEAAPDSRGGRFAPKDDAGEAGDASLEVPTAATAVDPAQTREAAIAAVRQKAANCDGSLQCSDEVIAEARRLGILTSPDIGECLMEFLGITAGTGAAAALGTAVLAYPEEAAQLLTRLIADEEGSVPPRRVGDKTGSNLDEPEEPSVPHGGPGHNLPPRDGEPPEVPPEAPPVDAPPEMPPDAPDTPLGKNGPVQTLARWALEAAQKNPVAVGAILGAIVGSSPWLKPYASWIEAYIQPPQTLKELQNAVKNPADGTDIHHIVEQTPGRDAKFGEDQIEGSDNLVRISRIQHWRINKWYQTPNADYEGLSPREYLQDRSWEERYRVGLKALRQFGVLQP